MPDEYKWFEDASLWDTMRSRMFSEKTMGKATEEVDHIVARLGIAPPARVLDLCCGVGRHTVELARRGFHVTGVDRTAAYLETAKQRAADAGVSAEFIQDDMRKFCREGAFDAVINVFTSFGYFEDQADDRRVLTNISRSLNEGGVFFHDVVGKEVVARIFRAHDWQELEDGSLMLEDRKVTKDWAWIENRWILFDESGRHEFQIGLRLYSASELRESLIASGFSNVTIYGDFAGAPYDHEAKRLIAVARK